MPTLETPTAAPTAPRKKSSHQFIEYDKYIDTQVERTRRAVKLVDLSQAMLLLVTGLMAFLLTAAVMEHWIIPGGFSTWGRTGLFAILIGGVGYFAVRTIWPLLTQSINPSYAAQAIEREHPTLKNSLLNFLLFRSHRSEMPPAVFDALEEQAAQRLSQTTVEGSVDRGPLIRLGYLLLAMTVVAILYTLVSQTNPLVTAARVLMPWADFAPPSRVRITKVEPGNVEIVQGDSLEIAARISGLGPDEEVRLSYDTADGLRLGESIVMRAADDAGKFTCHIPTTDDAFASSGIQQDLRYRILAGDGRTIDYAIIVLTAPAIRVRRVHYDFPDYTGYEDHEVKDRGDIRAIEGTKVTIFAEANSQIESAHLDMASDGQLDKRMRTEGAYAQVGVDLRIEGDRRAIRHTSYQLHYTNMAGLANKEPTQHSIEVLPDYAPEIELTEPTERVREVQLNETVTLNIDARDPDFALAKVWIRMEKEDGSRVVDQELLDKRHEGRFVKQWNFTPSDHDLQPGDVVEYWAEAVDVRAPQANRSQSIHKKFHVVGGEAASAAGKGGEQSAESGEQSAEGGEQSETGEGKEGGKEGESGESGESGENGENENSMSNESAEGNPGGDAGEPGESADGNQNGNETGTGGEPQEGGDPTGNAPQGAGGDPLQRSQEQQPKQNGEPNPNPNGNPKGGAAENQNTEPVASDGSDDATAFEKIQKQLNEQEQKQATRQKTERQPNGDPLQQSPENKNSENKNQENANQQETSEGSPQPKESEGAGAPTKSDTPQAEGGEPTGEKPNDESQSTGGEEKPGAGEPGAGEEASPEGSPEAQREQQQRDKRPDTGEPDAETDSTEPPMPGHSKKESDSQGEQGGDRSGGGEEGGGQDAPRDGTGSSGQNQPADEGGGLSADQGPGETGARAGDAEKSNDPTGNASDDPGEAASVTDPPRRAAGETDAKDKEHGDTGEESQGNPEGQPNQGRGRPGSQGNGESQESDSDPQEGQPDGDGGTPSGAGGTAESGSAPPNNRDGTVADADDANLEYARKQTKLVLDQLEDQLDKNQVDQDLLDKLGWEKKDLQKFVDRWKKLSADAARPGADVAQQELDARLRNLGPSIHPTTGRTLRKQDDFRDLREGFHDKVPLKYRDRLKAYTESVSKSRE